MPYSPQAAADRGSSSTRRAAPDPSLSTSRSVNADGPGRGTAGTATLRVAHTTTMTATATLAAATNHATRLRNRIRMLPSLDVTHLTSTEGHISIGLGADIAVSMQREKHASGGTAPHGEADEVRAVLHRPCAGRNTTGRGAGP